MSKEINLSVFLSLNLPTLKTGRADTPKIHEKKHATVGWKETRSLCGIVSPQFLCHEHNNPGPRASPKSILKKSHPMQKGAREIRSKCVQGLCDPHFTKPHSTVWIPRFRLLYPKNASEKIDVKREAKSRKNPWNNRLLGSECRQRLRNKAKRMKSRAIEGAMISFGSAWSVFLAKQAHNLTETLRALIKPDAKTPRCFL